MNKYLSVLSVLRFITAIVAVICVFEMHHCDAVILDFENFAPVGSSANISPIAPYLASGFEITPSNSQSAVIDPASGETLKGDSSAWFEFQGGNILTLAETDGQPFDLDDVLVGLSSSSDLPSVDVTFSGTQSDGETFSKTFRDLATGVRTGAIMGDIVNVTIQSTTDAGLDDKMSSQSPSQVRSRFSPSARLCWSHDADDNQKAFSDSESAQ